MSSTNGTPHATAPAPAQPAVKVERVRCEPAPISRARDECNRARMRGGPHTCTCGECPTHTSDLPDSPVVKAADLMARVEEMSGTGGKFGVTLGRYWYDTMEAGWVDSRWSATWFKERDHAQAIATAINNRATSRQPSRLASMEAAAERSIDRKAMGRMSSDLGNCRSPVQAPLSTSERTRIDEEVLKLGQTVRKTLEEFTETIVGIIDRTA